MKPLRDFVRFNGVSGPGLSRVAQQPRYTGAEMVSALSAYAILYDAAYHDKVGPERAQRIINHVLPALEEGQVGIRLMDFVREDAALYFGWNESNDRYEANTLYLPKKGIDLKKRSARGVIVHEAEHIASDATRQVRNLIESEHMGHAAYADYMLRDSGAMVPTGGRFRLSHDAFQKMQRHEHGAGDRKLIFEAFANAAQANAEAGRSDLNDLYAEEGRRVGDYIRENNLARGEAPTSFERAYIKAIHLNSLHLSHKSFEDVRRMYQQPAPADGL